MKNILKKIINSKFLKFNFNLKSKKIIFNLWFQVSFILLFISQFGGIFTLTSFSILFLYLYILFKNTLERDVIFNIYPKNIEHVNYLIKISPILFIVGIFIFDISFLFMFLVILLINGFIYKFLPNHLKELEMKNQYKKDFGENSEFSKEKFIQNHIEILFEKDNIDISNINLNILKNQYKKMAKKYHPDINKNHENKFYDINNSYNELKKIFEK